jgi:hypothetical protein
MRGDASSSQPERLIYLKKKNSPDFEKKGVIHEI